MRLTGSICVFGALAAMASAGCAAPTVEDVADASGATTEGVVVVERAVSADGTQTNVSAKFMRLSAPADPDIAERVVGARVEVPSPGKCVAHPAGSADTAVASLASVGSIELLDVGDVTMRAERVVLPLAARAFPDVGERVSGVFYTSRDAASDLPAAARYALEGTGSDRVDRFLVEGDAPPALEEVRVGETSLAESIALEDGAGAHVRWKAPERSRDTVLVDLAAPNGALVRCSFEDGGDGVIPASLVSAKQLGASITIAVHRVRELPFSVSGLDVGALRFDLSAAGRATLSPRTAALQTP